MRSKLVSWTRQDDNDYPKGVLPALRFAFTSSSHLHVVNNECGFRAANVEALCGVRQSTKAAKDKGRGTLPIFARSLLSSPALASLTS
jgi:hypothetical protein